jgi:predicted RNA-binding protein (virulence factor B family)
VTKYLEAGTVEKLRVDRAVPFGYFLTNEEVDVLLHHSEISGEINIDDEIEVFLFQDKQGRLSSTMKIPSIRQGVYVWSDVVEVKEEWGVFVNIGLSKDVLVSKDDLPLFTSVWPRQGDRLCVTLATDKHGRLFAKLATEPVIQDMAINATESMRNQDVKGTIYRTVKVGSYMLTEEGYRCFLHESERKEEPRLGSMIQARVIDVKEDGSLNITIAPRKQEKMGDDAEVVYTYLLNRNGSMPYSDKSLPGEIDRHFSMSKASFKRALGMLMREKKVYQEDGWTYVVKEEQRD